MKKPSEEFNEYWIRSKNEKIDYPKPTKHNGKWLIFAERGDVLDKIWGKVKKLTEEGKLGSSSKVSTEKDNEHSQNKKYGVICVYTYNSEDKKDLKRIAKELFKIEDIKRLSYKEDILTHLGVYSKNNPNRKISKYSVTRETIKKLS